MRAVQQSMTMAMAVNMASSPPSFMSPVGSGSAVQSHNPQHQQPPSLVPITHQSLPKDGGVTQTQPVPGNHSSRYSTSQQFSTNNVGSSSTNSRQNRKRRANSNATDR